jgi:hypothetical protein
MDALAHTRRVRELLAQGRRAEAAALHDAWVSDQLETARAGGVINLSDLFAAKEELEMDRTDSRSADPNTPID